VIRSGSDSEARVGPEVCVVGILAGRKREGEDGGGVEVEADAEAEVEVDVGAVTCSTMNSHESHINIVR